MKDFVMWVSILLNIWLLTGRFLDKKLIRFLDEEWKWWVELSNRLVDDHPQPWIVLRGMPNRSASSGTSSTSSTRPQGSATSASDAD